MDGFQRRRERKKLDILEATLHLFMKFGVSSVSIANIAKEANVSQVTIYNYFDNKQNLIHEVMIYYADKEWIEYEKLVQSDMPFPEKIKLMIFIKKEAANNIHSDFYQDFMKQYTMGVFPYIEQLYKDKIFPSLINLFNEGREQGYVDPTLSNESILFYIQLLKDAMQREEVYQAILPMTEELIKIFFYGLIGRRED